MQQKAKINKSSVLSELRGQISSEALQQYKKFKNIDEDIIREYMDAKQSGTLESEDHKGNEVRYDDYIKSKANKQTIEAINFLDEQGANSLEELYNKHFKTYFNQIESSVSKLERQINSSSAKIDEDVSSIDSLGTLGKVVKKLFDAGELTLRYGGKKILQSVNIMSLNGVFLGTIALVLAPLLFLSVGKTGMAVDAGVQFIGVVIASAICLAGSHATAEQLNVNVGSRI